MMFRKFAWIACLAVALIGCGSDDSDDANTDDTEEADGDSSSADSASAGAEADDGSDDELAACVESAADKTRSEDCATCVCENCADLFDVCANNEDPNFVAKCMAVVNCGVENNCQGTGCFCGMPEDPEAEPDIFACAEPKGACITEIADAAGGDGNPLTILAVSESMDMNEPLYVANALGRCMVGDIGITGACNAECQP